MESVAYFLDKNNFEILDVVNLQNYEINIDEETNAKSKLVVMQKLNATDQDFVFIKEKGKMIYVGIIESPVLDSKSAVKYEINATYITNLFNRDIILKNETLISNAGLEDFIEYTIKNNFTNSDDLLLNKSFIDIEVLTHTKKKYSVPNENGIYNFHTFITNCAQNYNIKYDFAVIEGRLKLTIYNADDEEVDLIDCNVSDITNYLETYETNVVAKVTVLTESKAEYNYYLLNDRTTTTDKNNQNRAVGDIQVTYESEAENVQETAMNIFKGNSYSHLIQFDININSKLYEVKSWYAGKKIKIKNKDGKIIDSYISAITKKKDGNIWQIKTGNIRITLLDKLKKEREGK